MGEDLQDVCWQNCIEVCKEIIQQTLLNDGVLTSISWEIKKRMGSTDKSWNNIKTLFKRLSVLFFILDYFINWTLVWIFSFSFGDASSTIPPKGIWATRI